ncbi:MAG: hypothetical protein GWP91_21965 [Rhodobacterales bacterium]|nr:hypothetical protein [Rhodobacterales bacterium]
MKPSDTHIERMAETFAERTPFLRENHADAKEAWREALEIGRDDGMLTKIEAHMKTKGTVDAVAQDVWDQAREY